MLSLPGTTCLYVCVCMCVCLLSIVISLIYPLWINYFNYIVYKFADMGISVEQYRAVIGCYNRCKFIKCGLFLRIRCLSMNVLFVLVIAGLYILLSGDIEVNPGPTKCRNITICHC